MVNISEVPMRSGGENSMSTDAPEEYRARRNSSLIDSTYIHSELYLYCPCTIQVCNTRISVNLNVAILHYLCA